MTKYNDLEDVTISNVKVGDVVKYTADGWKNAPQVEVKPPDGNVCGEGGGSFNPDAPQTLTDKWTWEDAGCPAIEVKDTVGSNAGDSAYICSNRFVVQNENGMRGEFKTRTTDGVVELRAHDGELKFRDNKVTTPVSLSDLLKGSENGTGESRYFPPMIHDFELGTSQSTPCSRWEADAYGNVDFGYDLGWEQICNTFGFTRKRHKDVLRSQDWRIDVPQGANAAIIFYFGRTEFGIYGGAPDSSSGPSDRALGLAHRCECDWVTFPIAEKNDANTDNPLKLGFGQSSKAIVNVPHRGQDIIDTYKHTGEFCKFEVIVFERSEAQFRSRVDVLKGGRGGFKTNLGRIVLFPFYAEDPTQIVGLSDEFNPNMFAYSVEDELDDIYDRIDPPVTPELDAFMDGLEYRNLLGRVINSLDSRKNYPPAGGATEAEFDTQIANAWALLDNTTLETTEEFREALNVYITEVQKDKYGIYNLFEFEKQAGVTSRGVL